MAVPVDPTSAAFLFAESRQQPMHVGGLQLFDMPEDAGPDFVRDLYCGMLECSEVSPLFLKRPHRSIATGGQWVWVPDQQLDLEYHVRHSALPRPGRIRELLELCGRLHGTRLARERPLWETHVIEGLEDDRVAIYTKMHHALVDGVNAMRLLQSVLSTDPDERELPPPWAPRPHRRAGDRPTSERSVRDLPVDAVRTALGRSVEAAGLPLALARTLARGVRNQASPLSLYAPRTILNRPITGSRRFAAQDWPIERMRTIGRSVDATVNDVVLAMCSGALRSYLDELGELPDSTLVAMVPVSLDPKETRSPSAEGGNAVGAVMVQLGTHLPDPGDRLRTISASMRDGKQALQRMTPLQIMAMSALGLAPAVAGPLLRLQGITRPPFNLVISNVPGPQRTQYYNGARLDGMYPLSIPIHGMALNITCASYRERMGFGLTGCRRTVPRLQRLLTHLDEELTALEKAAGVHEAGS